MSGYGPYYGQIFYFKRLFESRWQDIVHRFIVEARRVTGVLESRLREEGRSRLWAIAAVKWIWRGCRGRRA